MLETDNLHENYLCRNPILDQRYLNKNQNNLSLWIH